MPSEERKIFTLSVILNRIREIMDEHIHGKFFWLKVEIANITFPSSGHCYLELAETKNGENIATCSSVIWRSSMENIRRDLGKDFQNILRKGNEILCYAEIQFSVKFGFQVLIKNIDIQFNLGALERKKQETLKRIEKENLLDKNKQLILPIVIQKIAIVGSPHTSGFEDLLKQLKINSYGYLFDVEVFSTSVQGAKAEEEILYRLNELKNSRFHVIALIRGGGSKLDLEVFNSYNIAKTIALHDKPIFTGIGHETDLSVADIVANIHHKTPTALGSYIVEKAREFEVQYMTFYNNIIEFKDRYLEGLKSRFKLAGQELISISQGYTRLKRGDLHKLLNRINSIAVQIITNEKRNISFGIDSIKTNSKNYITSSKRDLSHTLELIKVDSTTLIRQGLEQFNNTMEFVFLYSKNIIKELDKHYQNILEMVGVYHPNQVMKKGYAIPRVNGKLLRDQELKHDEELEIELYNKILIVTFQKIKKIWMKKSIMNKLLKN